MVREHTSFHSLETLVNIPCALVKNICSVVVGMQYPRGQIRLRLCHCVVGIFDIFVDVYFACLSCC